MILLFSTLTSFLGSLQLGIVNVSVMDTTLRKGTKAAFYLALGGSLTEILYCSLACSIGSFLADNAFFINVFRILVGVVLLFIAFRLWHTQNLFLFSAKSDDIFAKSWQNFLKGFGLASLNPQLLPFWLLVHISFNSYDFLVFRSYTDYINFIVGAGLGAFVLLVSLILLVHKYRKSFQEFISPTRYQKILAIIFIVIALQQLWAVFTQK
ncbi:MAG: hypothetical protein OHK0045_04020 [Raineya sp.]